jgi:hypothetical protein
VEVQMKRFVTKGEKVLLNQLFIAAVLCGSALFVSSVEAQIDVQYGTSSTLNLDQVGEANQAWIETAGLDQYLGISQNGERNKVDVGLRGTGSDNSVGPESETYLRQRGASNDISVTSIGDNGISQWQIGDANKSRLVLQGSENSVRTFSKGAEHEIDIRALGDVNLFDLEQRGESNSVDAQIEGTNNELEAKQDGSGNMIASRTAGEGNGIRLLQDGDGNYAEVDQNGDRNSAVAEQRGSEHLLSLRQYGNDNSFDGGQASRRESTEMRVSQRGSENQAYAVMFDR